MTKPTQSQFRWQFNFKILLFALFFLPLTVSLGFWQLERAQQKAQLLERYSERRQSAPVSLMAIDHTGDRQYLRVQLSGKVRPAPTLLLDNKVHHGRVGFEVHSIIDSAMGPLLVNRGWIAAGASRQQLPEIQPLQGEKELLLTGYLYQSPGNQVMLAKDNWAVDSAVVVVQNASPGAVSERMGEDFYPYVLRVLKGEDGLIAEWPVVNVRPEKHVGYAVQWFAMAVVLVLLTLFSNSNLSQVLKRRPESPG